MIAAMVTAWLLHSLNPEVRRTSIKPSETDPAIDQFDSDHSVFLDSRAIHRGELLLFLPIKIIYDSITAVFAHCHSDFIII